MENKKENKISKGKIIAIVVAVILAIVMIPSAIMCIVYKESPADLIKDIFSPNSEQIIGKWQGEEGVTAYEFFEDGTYDSYISTFSYNGAYEISGNKITLKNSSLDGTVTYKFSINGDKLTMKILESTSSDDIQKEVSKYTKVDKITMLSITDMLDDFVQEKNQEKETTE